MLPTLVPPASPLPGEDQGAVSFCRDVVLDFAEEEACHLISSCQGKETHYPDCWGVKANIRLIEKASQQQ